jgi:hypothetical protein
LPCSSARGGFGSARRIWMRFPGFLSEKRNREGEIGD